MSKYYGKNITPILDEIAQAMWEIDSRDKTEPYEYGDTALRSACKIMMSVCTDKLWNKQEAENTSFDERCVQASALGNDFREFIKKHLGVDSHDFYKSDDDKSITKGNKK